jgi:acetyl esterase/lipase
MRRRGDEEGAIMAGQELAQAIAVQREMLQEMSKAQTPEENRTIYARIMSRFAPAADVTFESVDAGGVPAEWMNVPGASPERTILYLHGGGYVIGSPAEYRDMLPRLARAAGARALAVDYRLAPEHAHPAAVDDAVTAYRWLLDSGARPEGIVIAGDSAGGGLTVAMLVTLRDRGIPLPAAGVCISPWVDLEGTGASMESNAARDPLVQKELVAGMAQAYLQGQDPRQPTASPLYADLTGLPPLLIHVGDAETLLDDAARLAARAREAGVDVTYEVWPDMIHVWHSLAAILPEGQQAIERAGEFIAQRTALAGVS